MSKSTTAAQPGAAPYPLVIGHRGAPFLAPENSLEALRVALEEGADGVEFDVQLSADGELVVFHDDDLRQLTGRTGAVSEWSWRELSHLRVRGANRDAPIAHLDQVIELLERPHLLVNAELKCRPDAVFGDANRRLADALARRLAAIDTSRWLVSSFDPSALRHFAQHGVAVRLGALIDLEPTGWCDLLPQRTEADVDVGVDVGVDADVGGGAGGSLLPLGDAGVELHSVHPAHSLVDSGRADIWNNAGLAVVPWTVNGEADWQRIAPLDVAAMITDHPGRLRAFLERHGLRRVAASRLP